MTYPDSGGSYRAPNSRLADALVHLRNKNLAVIRRARSVPLALVERAASWLERLRRLMLRWAGWEVVVSEQVIEVPLVMRLITEAHQSVLDFGGFESTLPLALAALGHNVTVLDQRPYPFRHPRLRVACADLLGPTRPFMEQFDAVISISTVEHVGLGYYGDPRYEDGDRQAIDRLWELVKPGGRLIVTLPAGRAAAYPKYRVYDQARIRGAFPNATRTLWFRKRGRQGWWEQADALEVSSLAYSEPEASMPSEGVVIVLSDKSA